MLKKQICNLPSLTVYIFDTVLAILSALPLRLVIFFSCYDILSLAGEFLSVKGLFGDILGSIIPLSSGTIDFLAIASGQKVNFTLLVTFSSPGNILEDSDGKRSTL